MNYISQIISMAVLLVCSGLFSGCETAYFNISRRKRRALRDSDQKLRRTAADLLDKPHRLLTTLLFGNMAVNVLYFSLSSILSIRLSTQQGPLPALLAAVIALFALLLFGEMLPKSLAFYRSENVCIAAAPFCMVTTRLLWPLTRLMERFIITPLMRLIVGTSKPSSQTGEFTVNQFKVLIESSRQQGLITGDENQLFGEIMELSLLKVRHVMRPRVDMIAAEISTPPQQLRKLMQDNNLTKIPVYKNDIDNIVGMCALREIILKSDKPLKKIVTQANFVPEQKTIESLLEFFRSTSTDTAIVVDEYGGVAGMVSLEDCVEEILGPMDINEDVEPIEQIAPLTYRLSGNLAIHDWAEAFDIDIAHSRMTTIAGLTTALLGRIPKSGDTVHIKNLKLTVENLHKHRIRSLILTFEKLNTSQET
jgi:putative hemolysin